MRRIVVASPGYLKRRGEPKTPEAIASHQTIQFGATTARRTGALSRMAARFAWRCTPRFTTNSADAAIQYAEQGGGLTRVLAYQAADALKAGRLKIVLAKFEQPPLPIHIVYPTSRLLSAKVRAFIDLVTEISDWHFGVDVNSITSSLLRHDAERRIGARDDRAVGLYEALRETDRAAGLDHLGLDREPLPDLRAADEIDRHADDVTSECVPRMSWRAAIAHRLIGQRGDQSAMDRTRARWCAAWRAAIPG